MPVNYGGRLGRIIKKIPSPKCEKCSSMQVQITSYLVGDPIYKCRKCKFVFSIPFSEVFKQ